MKTYKLVIYVPVENADELRNAIGEAGGGQLGKYSFCSFSMKGVGRFKPEAGAKPHIGEIGKLEAVEEERVEVVIKEDKVKAVLGAMKKVHPYEEMAYDLYLLENDSFEYHSLV